jgi:hypothetical protein
VKIIKFLITSFIILLNLGVCSAQSDNFRRKTVLITQKPIVIDSLSVIPSSIKATINNQTIASVDYEVDVMANTIRFNSKHVGNLATLSYNTLTWNWQQNIFLLDTSIIQQSVIEPYSFRAEKTGVRFLNQQQSSLQKQGSISRAIVVGNSQNTSVNSDLNLQITGELTPGIFIRANVSDRSIPVQPEGNTQNLQEFDQVFIEVWNKHNKLIAGDFETRANQSYFLQYQKRARGLMLETNTSHEKAFNTKVGGAISRGKFSRNILPGIEGNQGPYRLTGADGEKFVVVLAGTERIYINGEPLERGLDRDYVIDYNNAEITFTANRLITKDSRIIVEFQYADQQYARMLLLGEETWQKNNWTVFSKYYQEQDAKNQPLQFDLTEELRNQFTLAGDPKFNQPLLVDGSNQVGFNDQLIQYKQIDSLSYSIFVYSTNPDSAKYTVNFTQATQGEGDYVLSNPLANGKVYRWIAPDTIAGVVTRNGNYVPLRSVTPPQQQILWTNGILFDNDIWKASGELAYSKTDLNTFSNEDNNDNEGFAYKFTADKKWSLKKGKKLLLGGVTEKQNNTFTSIERFRDVEFERNWNIIGLNSPLAVNFNEVHAGYSIDSVGRINTSFETLYYDSLVNGQKFGINWNFEQNHYKTRLSGSYLTDQTNNRYFIRHKGFHEKTIKKITLRYEDESEENARFIGDSLSSTAYQFYWYRITTKYAFSPDKNIQVFAGQRFDRISNSSRLARAALAKEAGATLEFNKLKNQQIKATVQYRNLAVLDTNLLNLSPESTILWQANYSGKLIKGLIQQQVFFEFGSGLERRKSFQYVQVALGQGVYAHTDFNENGTKELDEFYISPFPYEANYIKVYLPTDDYVKAFSRRINYGLSILPSAIWLNSKNGFKNIISKFSTQHNISLFSKTSDKQTVADFVNQKTSPTLLTAESSQTHRLYFNQFDPAFGVTLTNISTNNTQLLTDGFQQRNNNTNTLGIRKKWKSYIQTLVDFNSSFEETTSDFLEQQNFKFFSKGVRVELNAQLSKHTNLLLDARYANKTGDANVFLSEYNAGYQYTSAKTGNIQAKIGLVNTSKPETNNASLQLSLLEGYVPGKNYTWSLISQQQVAENLQLTINYQARTAKNSPTIHVGTVQVRAFF